MNISLNEPHRIRKFTDISFTCTDTFELSKTTCFTFVNNLRNIDLHDLNIVLRNNILAFSEIMGYFTSRQRVFQNRGVCFYFYTHF